MKASDYKKLASQKQVVEEVTLPSGAVFKMRLAPIEQWATSGVLPASLTGKMRQAAAKSKEEADEYVLRYFTEQDFVDSQSICRRLLEYCCVEPKVKINPSPEEESDVIAPEDILPEDFPAVMKWIWSGGRQGETLSKFHQQAG